MAPFDNPPSSSLKTKISPLIEGQLPDFVRDDHPLFTKFIEYYYQYLEAAELIVDAQVDNVIQETVDVQYILDEDSNQIVYEDSDGKFTVGETITGSKSKATATILIDDQRNNRLFITSAQQFVTDEVIVGATSGSEGKITRYRGNPVQNIQQLLDYADTDRTISDFLDQLSTSFMNAIPKKLVGWNPQGTAVETINRRNLIKNIRELYRLKGTSESFKLFIKILLNLDSEIVYPRKFMMRPSAGNYSRNFIVRTTAISSAVGDELVGQKRFHAHVAKNSLQIILRQLKLEEKNNRFEKNRLKEILKIDKDLNELNKILCQKIDTEEININDNDLIDHLFKTTMEKLSIDQPNYSAYLDEKAN